MELKEITSKFKNYRCNIADLSDEEIEMISKYTVKKGNFLEFVVRKRDLRKLPDIGDIVRVYDKDFNFAQYIKCHGKVTGSGYRELVNTNGIPYLQQFVYMDLISFNKSDYCDYYFDSVKCIFNEE